MCITEIHAVLISIRRKFKAVTASTAFRKLYFCIVTLISLRHFGISHRTHFVLLIAENEDTLFCGAGITQTSRNNLYSFIRHQNRLNYS